MLSSDCNRQGFILDFETFPRHPFSYNVKMIVRNNFRFGFFCMSYLELVWSFQQPEGSGYNMNIAAKKFPPTCFG